MLESKLFLFDRSRRRALVVDPEQDRRAALRVRRKGVHAQGKSDLSCELGLRQAHICWGVSGDQDRAQQNRKKRDERAVHGPNETEISCGGRERAWAAVKVF